MSYADTRSAILHLAADNPDVANTTLKRSLDLLTFFEIEELEVASVRCDEWGAIVLAFAHAALPELVVSGYEVTALSSQADDSVAKLINAITCAADADELESDGGDEDEA
jgi:hypothetical protein